MADPSWHPARLPLRIGDAERDVALRELGDHFAAGRIDSAEFDERASAALAARTQPQLDVLFADLPRPRAARRHPRATADACPAARPDRGRPAAARPGGRQRWLAVDPVAVAVVSNSVVAVGTAAADLTDDAAASLIEWARPPRPPTPARAGRVSRPPLARF